MTRDTLAAICLGFFLCAVLNTMPFTDSEKYRRAVYQCEKNLPRDQHCKVVGVPE